ncbi:sensor domain-containing diguanylate cyclase [Shewanella litorisediminis]|uniref:diguanylate cyclase n=1 Tax=Shewanella litorisediminis TaxID=1173586 RepID=A0ABX7G2A3_9GAMM|nr:diguanylate cyclase [Shewanella litorisediminis]MCL2918589.1 diguanylate cyclase [Shewanella litorisediminis]QRH01414.1 diguanylate cyclase [Shewanella litorisediminis]
MGRLLLLLLALGYSLLVQAAGPSLVYTEEAGEVIDLTPWVSEFQARELLDYRKLPPQNDPRWHQLPKQGIRGMGAQNRWLRFDIDVRTHPGSRVLSINNPLLDNLRIYHLVNGNLMDEHHFGDSLPFDERLLQSTQFLYPLQLRPWEHHTLLLRVDTEGSPHVPLKLVTPGHLSQMLESRNLSQGFQLGILTAIGLFSLFVALASGSFSYSYYAAYVLSMTLLVASLQGVAFRYLWPQLPAMQAWVIPFLLPLVMCFALMFAEKVLQLKYLNIRMLRICRFSAAFSLFLALLSPFVSYNLAVYCDIVALLGIAVVLLAFALVQALRGQKLARLYFIGWIVLLASVIVSSLIYLGVIQTSLDPLSPAMAGVTFEIVFMSLVLAIRYSDERKAKQRIQQEALEQAKRIREAREEALKTEAESNERLEEMVQERTLELEIALRELNEVNQKLTEQTTIDSLTGVRNRAAFNKRLQAEGRISRRQQTPMALLMLDIDHFKNINDKYGHLAGDHTLKIIADTLSTQLRRPTDLVSRFGGEEFAIILPSTDAEGAVAVAEHIREAVEQLTIEWEQFEIPLTVSIGVSSNIIESDEHPLQLLEQADKALYQAKHDGRNRVSLFQDMPVPHS